ncbi:putative GNAT family acetyltransferase [Aspergillus floccosus]
MDPRFTIIPATTPTHISTARTLFTSYADWLALDLTFQNFSSELASLPGPYTAPHGALLLAYSTTDPVQPLGCVAVRPLPNHPADAPRPHGGKKKTCEMKRLYVLPKARGMGLGSALVQAVVRCAKDMGYSEMRLDTLPRMQGAIALYRRAGFGEIEAYYETPLEGTVFLGLDLS